MLERASVTLNTEVRADTEVHHNQSTLCYI